MEFYGKSKKAEEETNKKTATEILNLKITNVQIRSYTETQQMPNLKYLAKRLEEDGEIAYVHGGEEKVATTGEKIDYGKDYKTIKTKLNAYPYEFVINENLKLASIDGMEIADHTNDKKIEELEERINGMEQTILSQQAIISRITASKNK